MRRWQKGLLTLGILLAMAANMPAQPSASSVIVTLRQLKSLTPEQAAQGTPVRLRGVVVCYDAGWHQLYVNDGRETLYFNADDFATQPKKGDLIEMTGKARSTNVLDNPKLSILGQTNLPAARPLELSSLGREHGEWVEVRGRVLSVEASRGRLAVLLNEKEQNCLVYLLGCAATNDFKQWLNCRVEVRGINASRMDGDRLESGLLFAPGLDEIRILEPAGA